MIGEFLIFNIVMLVIAIILNKKRKLGLFSKNKGILLLVVIISFFVCEFFGIWGYARHWWDPGFTYIPFSLHPVYFEDALSYVVATIIVVAVWERCKKIKFGRKKKK